MGKKFIFTYFFILFSLTGFSQKYEKEFKWEINDLITGGGEETFSIGGSSVIWSLENFSEIVPYIESELKIEIKKQQRSALIYNQIGIKSGILKISVHSKIPGTVRYTILQQNSKSNRVFGRGILTNGENEILLEGIKQGRRLSLALSNTNNETHEIDIHIKDLIITGTIPRPPKKMKAKIDAKVEFEKYERPSLQTNTYCGFPLIIWKSQNFEKIYRKFGGLDLLCNAQKAVSIIDKIYSLENTFHPPGPAPTEPTPPKKPNIYRNEPIEPHFAEEEPVLKIIAKEDLLEDIFEQYKKSSYLNYDDILSNSSAYLVDLSGSVKGTPLNIIKAELTIMAEILPPQFYVSIYGMYSMSARTPKIESFKKRSKNDRGSALKKIIKKISPAKNANSDKLIPALKKAIRNNKTDIINVLTDTAFTDKPSLKDVETIRRMISRRSKPITINIYDFGSKGVTPICYEFVKLGTGKGKVHTNKRLSPIFANKTLEYIENINNPEWVKNEIARLQKIEDKEFAAIYTPWKEDYDLYINEHAQWEVDHANWEDGLIANHPEVSEYKKLNRLYKRDYKNWEKDTQVWHDASHDYEKERESLIYLEQNLKDVTSNKEELFTELIVLQEAVRGNVEQEAYINLLILRLREYF
ncbi:VWA domain-containing protein [Bacteriovoracaceae bacterium]|nr:VWA domain-containing protein [Bacteriovoracaceae bacterium]